MIIARAEQSASLRIRNGISGIWEMDGGGKREGSSIVSNAYGEVARGEESEIPR